MEAMISLNVTALMRLAYAAVPGFVARGSGTVINIASIVATAPEILNGVYGGTKAFVLALSQSMQHELADKGVRIQAVLPGATATDFWSEAGNPVENLPKEIVMSAEDMVDAALVGLAAGEVVTIPGLHDGDQWDRYEAQRQTLSGLFGNCEAAPRYR
jgi:short-subunit dehydrogenase